jgi:tetratricopeptide (TPR) repeat protein
MPIFRIMAGEGFYRFCERAFDFLAPHVKEYQRRRHFNFSEGRRHLESRNYAEAEKYLQLALADRATNSPQRLVDVLVALSTAQLQLGQFEAAEASAQAAVEAASHGADAALHASALESVACVQLGNKQFVECQQTIAQIQALELGRREPNYPLLARCARMQATVLQHDGRAAEALEAARKAAEFAEYGSGPEDAETAHALTALGTLHTQQGNHTEAQQCLRRALEIHSAAYGADSAEATHDICLLAASLEGSGDTTGAISRYEQLLAMYERQVGFNGKNDAETRVRLAVLYLEDGRLPAARELLVTAIAAMERRGEGSHESLLLAFNALAFIEDQMGRTDAAEGLREKAARLTLDSAAEARP